MSTNAVALTQTKVDLIVSPSKLILPAPIKAVFPLLYPAQFIYGFEKGVSAFQGSVPPGLGRYRNLEPGHYSTVLNVLNANRSQKTIQIVATVNNLSSEYNSGDVITRVV